MLIHRHLLLISSLVLCNVSCVKTLDSTPPETEKKDVKIDTLVGRVSALYPEANYMLIQKYRSFDTDVDTIFYSRGSGGTINPIKMTEQRLGQFYVADLVSGNYQINDPIFMRNLRNSTEVDATQPDRTLRPSEW